MVADLYPAVSIAVAELTRNVLQILAHFIANRMKISVEIVPVDQDGTNSPTISAIDGIFCRECFYAVAIFVIVH